VGTAGASGAGQGDKRPAEDAREYARRLRSPPIDQVLGDVVVGLLHAAQAKLGRRDARLLTGVTAVAHEHARPYLPGELTRQIDQELGQLRPGQVNAESHASQQGQPEDNDLDQAPAPPPAGAAQCMARSSGCGRTPGSSSHPFPTSPRGANALSRACNRHRVPGV
jgi:hypothetical protein